MSRVKDNLLLHLASIHSEILGLVFESGTGNISEHIVLEGTIPFDDIVFFEYEGTLGQSNIILNGTDSSSNSGDNVITEDGFKLLQEEDTEINK